MIEERNDVNILIVDDNPKNLQMLAAVLSQNKYRVVVAQNGLQAIKSIETIFPDLILLDVVMPEMDGFETCKRLKASPSMKDIPIIFLTARTEPEDILKGFELGAADYIVKPFNHLELLARVQTHLELRFSREIISRQRDELNEILHILCHDLSNPLQAIVATLQLARNKPQVLEQKLETMHACCIRAIKLIQLVKSLQTTEEKTIPCTASVGLKESLMESIETLEHKFSQKNIRPVLDIGQDIDVIAEKTSLVNSIFNNILTNAVKFSYPDSKIMIRTSLEGEYISITIEDFGVGIAREIMDNLFKIDKKSTQYGTQGEKGTGFGMSIVKKFVTGYGGKIEVSSKEKSEYPVEHGTSVKITLKMVEPQVV